MPPIRAGLNPFHSAAVTDVSFTIGAETGGNNIVVSIQAKRRGANVAQRVGFDIHLSDAATGAGVVATAPSGAVAAGTNGTLADTSTAKKTFRGWTDAQGRLDISITEAAAKTLYVVVQLPDGTIKVSGAVTFA
jgi:hypothetical protein